MSVEESEPLCVETTSLELINRNIESLFSISNLSLCRNLVELNLHANHLVSIDNLASLTSIQRLILSSNHITTIQGLDSLRELNYLNLACNKIQIVQHLEGLVSLKKLVLSHNKITSLIGLRKNRFQTENSQLVHLDLKGNLITSITELDNLSSCHSLRELILSGGKDPSQFTNPICQGDIRKLIAEKLPQVSMLSIHINELGKSIINTQQNDANSSTNVQENVNAPDISQSGHYQSTVKPSVEPVISSTQIPSLSEDSKLDFVLRSRYKFPPFVPIPLSYDNLLLNPSLNDESRKKSDVENRPSNFDVNKKLYHSVSIQTNPNVNIELFDLVNSDSFKIKSAPMNTFSTQTEISCRNFGTSTDFVVKSVACNTEQKYMTPCSFIPASCQTDLVCDERDNELLSLNVIIKEQNNMIELLSRQVSEFKQREEDGIRNFNRVSHEFMDMKENFEVLRVESSAKLSDLSLISRNHAIELSNRENQLKLRNNEFEDLLIEYERMKADYVTGIEVLETIQKQYKESRHIISTQQLEITNLQNSLKTEVATHSSNAATIKKLTEKLHHLICECEKNEKKMEAKDDIIEKSHLMKIELVQALSEAQKLIENKDAQIAELGNTITQLNVKAQQVQLSSQSQSDALKIKDIQLKDQLDTIEKLKVKIMNLSNVNEESLTNVHYVSKDRDAAKNEAKELQEKILDIEYLYQQSCESLERKNKELHEATERNKIIEVLETEMKKLSLAQVEDNNRETCIIELKNRVNELLKSNESLAGKNESLENQIQNLKSVHENDNLKIRTVENEMRTLLYDIEKKKTAAQQFLKSFG